MAEAVQALWPGTQVTIGPVIENGFYYDFFRNQPFTPDDLPAIEQKMREIIARDKPFTKEVWSREQGQASVPRQWRTVQGRAGGCHPRRSGHQYLQARRLVRPLPRPAHDFDREGRQCLQAVAGRRRLLARQLPQPHAHPHLRHRLGEAGRPRHTPEESRRGREAGSSPARPRDGPFPFPGRGAGRRVLAPQGLDRVPAAHLLHAAPTGGRLSGGQCPANPRQVAVGDLGPLGLVPRAHVRHRDRGQTGLRDQADELSGARADFQIWPQVLPRSAHATGGIRRGLTL